MSAGYDLLLAMVKFHCGLAVSQWGRILMHVMSHSLSFPFLASSFQFMKKTLKQNSSPELIFSVPLWFSLLGLLHVSFLSLC